MRKYPPFGAANEPSALVTWGTQIRAICRVASPFVIGAKAGGGDDHLACRAVRRVRARRLVA